MVTKKALFFGLVASLCLSTNYTYGMLNKFFKTTKRFQNYSGLPKNLSKELKKRFEKWPDHDEFFILPDYGKETFEKKLCAPMVEILEGTYKNSLPDSRLAGLDESINGSEECAEKYKDLFFGHILTICNNAHQNDDIKHTKLACTMMQNIVESKIFGKYPEIQEFFKKYIMLLQDVIKLLQGEEENN